MDHHHNTICCSWKFVETYRSLFRVSFFQCLLWHHVTLDVASLKSRESEHALTRATCFRVQINPVPNQTSVMQAGNAKHSRFSLPVFLRILWSSQIWPFLKIKFSDLYLFSYSRKCALNMSRSPSLGECNSHTKPIGVRAFLQTGLFLDFFSREIDEFWSTWTRRGEEKNDGFSF